MKLSVCICTYNRDRYLDMTLRGVVNAIKEANFDDGDIELIIVNNNSSDLTDDVIRKYKSQAPIVKIFEPRQGLGYARNSAVEAATGDLVLWTDDDVLVDQSWLLEYRVAAETYRDAAFFGGPVFPRFEGQPPRWVQKNLSYLGGPYSLLYPVAGDPMSQMLAHELPFGGNMAICSRYLKEYTFNCRLGREGASLVGGEDIELIDRMKKDGLVGIWVRRAIVNHFIMKEKQRVAYITRWYSGMGRTTARTAKQGDTKHSIAAKLKKQIMTELRNDKYHIGISALFGGPVWLRAVKAAAYYKGFYQELGELHK